MPAQGHPYVVACLGSSSTAGKGQALQLGLSVTEQAGTGTICIAQFWGWRRPCLQRPSTAFSGDRIKPSKGRGFSSAPTMFSALCRLRRESSTDLQRNYRKIHLPNGSEPISRLSFDDSKRTPLRVSRSVPWPRSVRIWIRRTPSSAKSICKSGDSAQSPRVATEEGIDYISVYEAFSEQMKNSRRRPFRAFRFLAFYRDAFRTLVLGATPDDVSRLNGCKFHTDGVHLNSRGGLLVADLVQTFIENDGKSPIENSR